MGNNPSRFSSIHRPVEQVSYLDCKEFIEKLNTQSKSNYRLPSNAEWIFAAKGMNQKEENFPGSPNAKEVANYVSNSNKMSNCNGLKLPNELGIFDMCGNVSEWCEITSTKYENSNLQLKTFSFFSESPELFTLKEQLIRGGSWEESSEFIVLSNRYFEGMDKKFDDIGFRLARSI